MIPETAGELAEAALIGSLLLDPRRLSDVAWLRPEDFRSWPHRAIYQTMLGLERDGVPIDLLQLPRVLADGRYHDAGGPTDGIASLSAVGLYELIAIVPNTARGAHRRYAQIVLDDSIRHQVHAAGVRIAQATEADARLPLREQPHTLARLLAQTEQQLGQAHERATQGGLSSGDGLAASARADRARESSAASPTSVVPSPRHRKQGEAQGAERALIGGCVTQPDMLDDARSRLRREDLTDGEVAVTWDAIGALIERGEPVDVVLVARETERQSRAQGLAGMTTADLLAVARASDPVHAAWALERVTRAALTRIGEQTAQALRTAASDLSQPTRETLRRARQTLAAAEARRQRLDGVGSNTDQGSVEAGPQSRPTRQRPRPAPTAGPPPPTRGLGVSR